MKTVRWTAGLLGLWIALVPFLGFTPQGNLWNGVVVGGIAVVTGAMLARVSAGKGWTVAILGAWLIAAAFLPGLREGAGLLWNNLIIGLVIAYAAFSAPSGGPQLADTRPHDQANHAAHH